MDKLKRRVSGNIDGKIPPQAIELEEAVLGALMLEKDAFEQVFDILKPESFYKETNIKVFQAIQSLANKKEPIDILTVTKELKKLGSLDEAGGILRITQLTNGVASAANIVTHSRVVAEMHLKRELIKLASLLLSEAYDETTDCFEIIENTFKEVDGLRNFGNESEDVPFSYMLDERVKEKEEMFKNGVKFTGITTGNKELDKVLGGFVNSNLIIVAARPAMGKSVKALNYARVAAEYTEKPVLVFSLEMSSQELIDRFIVEEAKIPLHLYRANEFQNYDMDKIRYARNILKALPIQIYDEPNIGVSFVRKKAKKAIKNFGSLGMIVIDYVQLMQGEQKKGGTREQELSSITRGLKGLAKELNVPVIALAQVGRSAEHKSDKRPDLSDLRECLSVSTSYIYGEKNIQRNSNSLINLVSLNKNKIQMNESINIPKESNIVYRVKTSTGRFVDATLEHPILTSSGFKKVKDLSKTDSLAVAVDFCEGGEYIEESRFVGWMLGNGSFTGYSSPSFIISDETVANDFIAFVEKRFSMTPRYKKHWCGSVFQYEMTNPNGHNVVREWLKNHDMHGKRSWEKYIPDWFMEKADKRSICELMQGLFETDGSAYIVKGKNSLSYSSTSEKMINQISYLLAKIGIVSFVSATKKNGKAKHICYKLLINNAENLKLFLSMIAIRGRKGEVCKRFELDKRVSYTSNRISFDSCNEIKNWLEDNGYSKHLIQTHGGRRATKTKVLEISNNIKDERFNRKFSLIMSENIYWDTVVSIEEIGEVAVFDRSVENAHNFVVNGIIVHNSGAIENDADVVMFIYRPSYYFDWGQHPDDIYSQNNITETEYNERAEILVAKNRNGIPSKRVMEKFYGQYSTFKEYNKEEESDIFDNIGFITIASNLDPIDDGSTPF
jgi:replicative DNA helicase